MIKNAKYEHMTDGSHHLTEEYIEDCAQLLASSFLTKNVVWSNANLEFLKLKEFFITTLKHHFALQQKSKTAFGKSDLHYNQILIENGQLTACTLHYNIEQYRQELKENKLPEIALFRKLEERGSKLLDNVDLGSFEAGKTVYCSFGARSNIGKPPTISALLGLTEMYTLLRDQGVRYSIGRLSSEKTKYLYEKMGAEIVSKTTFNLENGKESTLYYFIFDMENPTYLKYVEKVKEFRESQKRMTAKL